MVLRRRWRRQLMRWYWVIPCSNRRPICGRAGHAEIDGAPMQQCAALVPDYKIITNISTINDGRFLILSFSLCAAHRVFLMDNLLRITRVCLPSSRPNCQRWATVRSAERDGRAEPACSETTWNLALKCWWWQEGGTDRERWEEWAIIGT